MYYSSKRQTRRDTLPRYQVVYADGLRWWETIPLIVLIILALTYFGALAALLQWRKQFDHRVTNKVINSINSSNGIINQTPVAENNKGSQQSHNNKELWKLKSGDLVAQVENVRDKLPTMHNTVYQEPAYGKKIYHRDEKHQKWSRFQQKSNKAYTVTANAMVKEMQILEEYITHRDIKIQAIKKHITHGNIKIPVLEENITHGDIKIPVLEEHITHGDIKIPVLENHITYGDIKIPVLEEHITQGDIKIPVLEEHITHGDIKIPVLEEYITHGDIKKPVLEEHITYGDIKIPVLEEHITHGDIKIPVLEEHITYGDIKIPVLEEHITQGDIKIPVLENHITYGDIKIPVLEEHITHGDIKIPVLEEHITYGDIKIPVLEEHITHGDIKIPVLEEHITQGDIKIPVLENHITYGDIKIPVLEEHITHGDIKIPVLEEHITHGDIKIPVLEEHITHGDIKIPVIEENITQGDIQIPETHVSYGDTKKHNLEKNAAKMHYMSILGGAGMHNINPSTSTMMPTLEIKHQYSTLSTQGAHEKWKKIRNLCIQSNVNPTSTDEMQPPKEENSSLTKKRRYQICKRLFKLILAYRQNNTNVTTDAQEEGSYVPLKRIREMQLKRKRKKSSFYRNNFKKVFQNRFESENNQYLDPDATGYKLLYKNSNCKSHNVYIKSIVNFQVCYNLCYNKPDCVFIIFNDELSYCYTKTSGCDDERYLFYDPGYNFYRVY